MVGFQFVGCLTTGPAATLLGITDLNVVWQGGTALLYSSGAPTGGVNAYQLSAGQAQFLDSESFAPSTQAAVAGQLEQLEIGSATVLVTLGRRDSTLECFDLDAAGKFAGTGALTTAGGFQTPIAVLDTTVLNGQQWVYASHLGENGLTAYTTSANGQMTKEFTTSTGPSMGPSAQGQDFSVIKNITVQGQELLITTSMLSNEITSYRINSTGSLTEADRIGSLDGLGIQSPTALAHAEIGGDSYLVVAAPGTDSLSVLRIDASGTMQVADHALGSMATRLGQVSVLESVTIDGQVFLIAGGGDDGLSLLTLLPGGRLLHLAQIADTAEMTLHNVSALALHVENGGIEVFATGESESGITHLRVDPSALNTPLYGDSANNTLTGTAGGDLISGAGGNDRINGGSGDDILLDGAGIDTLTGGSGSDIFVFSRDGQRDLIQDFDPNQDQLDLSALGYLRNLGQLTISTTSTGARILFGDEDIQITSATYTPISRSQLEAAIIMDLDHFADPLSIEEPGPTSGHDTLAGSATAERVDLLAGNDLYTAGDGADTVQGGSGSDRLYGEAGQDLLQGGDGDDFIYGGDGNDTVQGGGQFDQIEGGDGDDELHGEGGLDVVHGQNGDDLLTGGWFNDWLYGGAGTDTLRGDGGNDRLFGGGGGDLLEGGNHNDTMYGGDGNDTLYGETGNDRMAGGGGGDTLYGGDSGDIMYGDDGNDWVLGEDGNDVIYGGTGNDTVQGGGQFDQIEGGDGDDELHGEGGLDVVHGQNGNDLLTGGWFNDWLYGGEGTDTLRGDGGNDRLFGGGGGDLLDGGNHNDTMYGGDGNDTLYGETGNDRMSGGGNADQLEGGDGNDVMYGDGGDDLLLGENDNDQLYGGLGKDTLYGGGQFDRLDGGEGDDLLFGDGGHDTIYGQSGDDILNGGTLNDSLFGGNGADTLRGDGGHDVLNGGTGSDLIEGGNGLDTLFGGGGYDTINGGTGNDQLSGQVNADIFIFSGGFGQDTITDFEALNPNEKIDLSAVASITGFTDLSKNHMRQSGDNVVIDASSGNTITLLNVSLSDMDVNDFLF